jgi:hypothetical protein
MLTLCTMRRAYLLVVAIVLFLTSSLRGLASSSAVDRSFVDIQKVFLDKIKKEVLLKISTRNNLSDPEDLFNFGDLYEIINGTYGVPSPNNNPFAELILFADNGIYEYFGENLPSSSTVVELSFLKSYYEVNLEKFKESCEPDTDCPDLDDFSYISQKYSVFMEGLVDLEREIVSGEEKVFRDMYDLIDGVMGLPAPINPLSEYIDAINHSFKGIEPENFGMPSYDYPIDTFVIEDTKEMVSKVLDEIDAGISGSGVNDDISEQVDQNTQSIEELLSTVKDLSKAITELRTALVLTNQSIIEVQTKVEVPQETLDKVHSLCLVSYAPNQHRNWSGIYDEKWYRTDVPLGVRPYYYYILPDGRLYKWDHTKNKKYMVSHNSLFAILDPSYYQDMTKLTARYIPASGK